MGVSNIAQLISFLNIPITKSRHDFFKYGRYYWKAPEKSSNYTMEEGTDKKTNLTLNDENNTSNIKTNLMVFH